MAKYNRYPVDFIGITEKFSSSHLAIDMGWNSSVGGPDNEKVYAVNDGIVFDIGRSTGSGNAGNYVWIKWSDGTNDWYSRFAHLQDNSIKVSKGQQVLRGQEIATMGGTYGYAIHLHYDLWKCPLGYSFDWGDRAKYSVNPVDYTFAFYNQQISEKAGEGVIRVVGTNNLVARDTSKNQIEVVGYQLRCRADAGTDKAFLGYIDFGIYNYDATKEANGYTWYHIPAGWIAGTKEDTKVYPKEQPTPPTPTPDPKDEKIKELEAEIAKKNLEIKDLEAQNEALQKEIKELQEEIEELKKHGDLKVFTAPKEGYYYIYLQEGECVYLKA
jgi:hypothetical protein